VSLILARTGDDRARAKAKGVKSGGPAKRTAHQRQEALKRLEKGEESQADIARSFNVSQATISRLVRSPFGVSAGAWCHYPEVPRRFLNGRGKTSRSDWVAQPFLDLHNAMCHYLRNQIMPQDGM
jgi:hypothetical protein